MNTPLKRPTNIDELKAALSLFSSSEAELKGFAYQPDPTDVFIATYPKCGTTWGQQLAHCLRTRGDMDFGEITDVVPWLEISHDLGIDNLAAQKAKPHCFKSHLSWNQIPKGGKYIHITRNPESVLLSFYQFFEGWFFESGSIDIDTFAEDLFFQGTGSGLYWNHINEWWDQREREDILFLCYEHMLEDPHQLIRYVAEFMNISIDDDLMAIALEKSSATFMRNNHSHFNDHPLRAARDKVCGLPPGGDSSKISGVGGKKQKPILSPDLKQKMAEIWRHHVTPVTGLESYDDLLVKTKPDFKK